jgi:hypothetical protein
MKIMIYDLKIKSDFEKDSREANKDVQILMK